MSRKNIKTAEELGLTTNVVTITHTIGVKHGWSRELKAGDKLHITKMYFRNGETQLKGYVNDETKISEVPFMWTNSEFK
jgi:hypothetical protein